MYRRTIEHPDYLPIEVRKRTDFEGGKTMGRIWRVVRDDVKAEELKHRRNVNMEGARPSTSFARRSSIATAGTATRPTDCCSSGAIRRQ